MAAPANDNWDDATPLDVTADGELAAQTTIDATLEPDETSLSGSERTVWYSFTPATTSSIQFTTTLSVPDGPATAMQLFSGADIATAVLVAQDEGGGSGSVLNAVIIDGTEYHVQVSDQDAPADDFTVSWTAPTPVFAPDQPTGLTASRYATRDRALVTWTAPDAGGTPITNYQFEFAPDDGGAPGTFSTVDTGGPIGATTSWVFEGLDPATDYWFRVTAINAVGAGPVSDPTTWTTPDQPADLVATATSPTTVDVSWTAPTGGDAPITDYVVRTSIAFDGPYTEVSTGTTPSHTFTGLTPETAYLYWVWAVSAGGNSLTSDLAVAATPADATVSGVAATPTSPTTATVTWSPATGTSEVTGYEVDYSSDDGATWSGVSTGPDATSADLSPLTPSTTYLVRVAALTETGSGPFTEPVSFTTPAEEIPATAPDQVTGLTAHAGTGRVRLTWTAPANGGSPITDYLVEYGIGSPSSTFAHAPSAATSITVTGLTDASTYTLRVSAINAIGTGPASDEVAVTTPGPPAAPTGLTATAFSPTSIHLAWTAAADGGSPLTSYLVERSSDGGTTWIALHPTGTATVLTAGSLVPSTTYAFRVTAHNSVGAGPASSEASATTLDAPAPDEPSFDVRAELYSATGTLLATLDGAHGLSWQEALNEPGTGSITVQLDDDAAPLFTAGCVVRCYCYEVEAFAFIIDKDPHRTTVAAGEENEQVLVATGQGTAAAFADARIYPYKGVSEQVLNQNRLYTFASPDFPNTGDWVPAIQLSQQKDLDPVRYSVVQWITVSADPDIPDEPGETVHAPAPLGWLVPDAWWIWGTAPDPVSMPVGFCYFRKEFTLDATTELVIACTADNHYTLYLDGTPILGDMGEPGDTWNSHKRADMTLPAGTYMLAAVAENQIALPGTEDLNPAALLAAVYTVDVEDKLATTICVTDDSWSCLPYPNVDDVPYVPGWTPGQIVIDMITEAQARGALAGYDVGFDGENASNVAPWDGADGGGHFVPGFSVAIGGTILDALGQLVDNGWIDYRMAATLGLERTLLMFNPGGAANHVATVLQSTGDLATSNILSLAFEPQTAPTTRLLVKWSSGFLVLDDATAQTAHGVHEGYLTVDAVNAVEAARVAGLVLADMKNPVTSIVIDLDPVGDSDRPYIDFHVGDYVHAPTPDGTSIEFRLHGLTVTQTDSGLASFALEINSRTLVHEREQFKLYSSLGRGVTGDTKVRSTLAETTSTS